MEKTKGPRLASSPRSRKDPTSVLFRRLIPAVVLVPPLAGLLHEIIDNTALLPIEQGTPLRVAATVVGLLAVVAWTGVSFRRLEAERSSTETALRESEKRFRTAFEDAPIGMALVGLDGRWLDVNRALVDMIGYPKDELLQKTFQDLTYRSDLEVDLEDKRRLLSGDILVSRREKRYLHRDGHLLWVARTVSLVRNERGDALYFVTQLQDVTERRRAEQEQRLLADAGARLAFSLDPAVTLETLAELGASGLGDLCVIDLIRPQGEMETVAVATGSTLRDPRLQELLAIHPGRSLCGVEAVMDVIRSGSPLVIREVTGEMLESWAPGEEDAALLRRLTPLSLMGAPLVARGRILGAMILVSCDAARRYDSRDLEIAGEVAQRGAQALDNAHLHQTTERALRMRDEVLGIVAHDLRSPLNVIAIHAQILRLEGGRAEDANLELIEQAVSRASSLINDLLDAARMEAGQLPLVLEPVEVKPLLREVMGGHWRLAEEKLLRLEPGLIEDVPPINADRGRLLQIMANLLGNAIKFTPAGGRVTLGVRLEGRLVRFSVGNSGPGIPPEEIPHLFQPFWQSRRGGRDGAGLGLSIVRGLVEAHGGQIRVESTPGIYTTFFFTIPLAALPATSNSLSPNSPESAPLA